MSRKSEYNYDYAIKKNGSLEYFLYWMDRRKEIEDEEYYNHFLYEKISRSKKGQNVDPNIPLFKKHFNIPEIVTNNPDTINKWIEEEIINKKNVKYIGLDCETDAFKILPDGHSFIQDHFIPDLLDLIQISTSSSCLIIQTNEGMLIPPKQLINIFQSRNLQKILCNSVSDYDSVNHWFLFHGIKNMNIKLPVQNRNYRSKKKGNSGNHHKFKKKEIRNKFSWLDIDQNCGLNNLSIQYLGERIQKNKQITCSKWSSKKLSKTQIEYAKCDAYVTLRIFLEM